MTQSNDPVTLIIATRNAHKVGEIRAILGDSFRYLTLNDLQGAPKVIEDADSFAGNATKKAVELAHWLSGISNLKFQISNPGYVLADDSGLEVDALKGAPGVHSARFAALDSKHPGNSPDADNNAKLVLLLKDVPSEERTARFRCVIALTPVLPKPAENSSAVCYADELELQTQIFEGACEGRMDLTPRGQGGFGYDPLFIPDGFKESFAELGEAVKNRLSHRSKALAKLKSVLSR
jgi:XTP/dITP diphosphohydrolase